MRGSAVVLLLLVNACSGSETESPEPPPIEAGCEVGELTLEDGSCRPAGVPEDACAEGFAPNAEGCSPILPAAPCPPGQVALPGETACRPLVDCGAPPWGNVQADGTAQFVDSSYTGTTSTGSNTQPWTRIQDGIDAVAAGGMLVIAAGDYVEDLVIDNPVRLHGRCPDLVTVTGVAPDKAAIAVLSGASGSEIHGVGVRGAAIGVFVTGAEGVRLERVWVHDTASRGINAQPDLGPTGIILQDVLVESTRRYGVFSVSAAAEVDRLLVRWTQIDPQVGRGIGALFGLLDENRPVAIRRSAFIGNHADGLDIEGIDGTVDAVLVADTQPAADGTEGFGMVVNATEGVGAKVSINASVIERNHDQGLYVGGSEATVTATTVRDTFPQPQTQQFGRGVNVEDGAQGEPARLTMTSCLVERAWDVGALAIGAQATFESVLVRDVVSADLAVDESGGIGMSIQFDPEVPSIAVVGEARGCVIERAAYAGFVTLNAEVHLAETLVRGTSARSDGTYGDGIAIIANQGFTATATIARCRSETSARAGISSFGAHASLANTMATCNPIDLAAETYDGRTGTFEDLGGNTCGCPPAPGCKAQTANLAPPEPQ